MALLILRVGAGRVELGRERRAPEGEALPYGLFPCGLSGLIHTF
jgi:hypothetical protein